MRVVLVLSSRVPETPFRGSSPSNWRKATCREADRFASFKVTNLPGTLGAQAFPRVD
jgi:hypothetical protein